MGNKKSVNWVAGAAIAASALWLYLFSFPTPPAIDARVHQGLGEVLADEALKLLVGDARLIVITRDVEAFKLPAATAQVDSFLGAIKTAGKTPAAVRLIKVDPLRVVGVPAGEFFDILRQGKATDVIVSFLGPPMLSDDHLTKLGTKRPRVLALCSGPIPARIDLKKAFEQQILHAAVVSQPDAPAHAAAGNSRAAFDQFFKVITPGNITELPSLTATVKAD